MYKIGDFSKIVDIPVRTLRYYAECGVLIPREVDPFTGYKYYDDENVIECKLIKLLKSLDFTLDEIIEYKDSLDENILENKKKELEQRMYLLRLKHERITLMQEQIKRDRELGQQDNSESKILRRTYEGRDFEESA